MGPVVSYSEYHLFIHKNTDKHSPLKWTQLSNQFAQIIIGLVAGTIGYEILDFSIVPTPAFRTFPFWKQTWYAFVYCFLGRLRYMGVWGINHLSNMLAGVREVNEGVVGDFVINIDIFKIEKSLYMRERVNYWNIATSRWLRECGYNKFGEILQWSKSRASLFTFICSAFWHGFYPAYYFCFVNWYLILEIQKIIFKLSRYVPNKFVLNFIFFFTSRLWIFPGIVFFHISLKEMVTLICNLREWFYLIFGLYFGLNYLKKWISKKEKKESKNKEN